LHYFDVAIPDPKTRPFFAEQLAPYILPEAEEAGSRDDLWVQDENGIKIQLTWN